VNDSPRARRGLRAPLVWLGIAFIAPLGCAFWLYYGSGWRPAGHTNHGQLIEPVRALPVAGVPGAQALKGKWSLLVVATGPCASTCQGSLVTARQTWLSLGKLTERVQRVLLAGPGCCDADYLMREHEGLLRLDASAPEAAALLGTFPAEHQGQMIFIVDPLGNLMMRYDSQANPKGLRQDLQRLLDLSHIG
jgi:hypothetical protein